MKAHDNLTSTRLWLCLFLSAMETTIVSTSLLTIGEDLHDTGNMEWIVVVYLLTYNGTILTGAHT